MEQVWLVGVALLGGALRTSVPYLFVSLGECLTERAGRINLGNEGAMVLGAMAGYALSYNTGSPWVGVLAALGVGALIGALHAALCHLPRVSDVAVGIAIMLAATGAAFYFGKPYIQPVAPSLPPLSLGFALDNAELRRALDVTPLLPLGMLTGVIMAWYLKNTRSGLRLRIVGESRDAALAMGLSIFRTRLSATMIGSALAGVGGASLSLSYPGIWSEGLSSGQGLMAVSLVIFARWNPLGCIAASYLFGAASALGPALQTVGISSGYHLANAAPYVLTLAVMLLTVSPGKALKGGPGELSAIR
ncbi:ABC transporter permease [Celeribacter sp.]|uniref:ABC transporter permease n=1 Tax=Celeribacter sp. TaxID=1890673 RepID=UPI003A8DAAF3